MNQNNTIIKPLNHNLKFVQNRVQPIQRKTGIVLWKSVKKKVSIVQYNTVLRNYMKIVITRKNSSRMCTNRLEAIHDSVSVATTRCHCIKGGTLHEQV